MKINIDAKNDKLVADCLDVLVAFPAAVQRMREDRDISSIPDQMKFHTRTAFRNLDGAQQDVRVVAAAATDLFYRHVVSLRVLDEFTRNYVAIAIKYFYNQLSRRYGSTFYIVDNSLRRDRFLSVLELMTAAGISPFSPNTHGDNWAPIEQGILQTSWLAPLHISYIEPDAMPNNLAEALVLAKSLGSVSTFRNEAPDDPSFQVIHFPEVSASNTQIPAYTTTSLGPAPESSMFSIFKKQTKIHEPIKRQREEVLSTPTGPLAVSGEDCDEMAGATGPFGHSYKNPIPVNGQLGTYKYLTKLRSATGRALLFHRLGSMASPVSKYSVDVYEVVDVDGKSWDVIFVHMYHPRRSNNAPAGYTLSPFNSKTGDHIFGFGVDVYCPNFPYDMPEAIVAHNGFDEVSKLARKTIGVTTHLRPNSHKDKVTMVSTMLEGRALGNHLSLAPSLSAYVEEFTHGKLLLTHSTARRVDFVFTTTGA